MAEQKPIAIIPARGGSKRLPRKNILPVMGKPIIAYPIEAAQKSNLFSEIIVSTEDQEIADITSRYSVHVLDRPIELAQDHSSVVEVCTKILGTEKYKNIDTFCCIYATALFLNYETLIASYKKMYTQPIADFVMGVSSYNFPPSKALIQDGAYWKSMWPEFQTRKSQVLPNFTVSNGSFYWARRNSFLKEKTFYGTRLKVHKNFHIDIDDLQDYEKAQEIFLEKFGEPI